MRKAGRGHLFFTLVSEEEEELPVPFCQTLWCHLLQFCLDMFSEKAHKAQEEEVLRLGGK